MERASCAFNTMPCLPSRPLEVFIWQNPDATVRLADRHGRLQTRPARLHFIMEMPVSLLSHARREIMVIVRLLVRHHARQEITATVRRRALRLVRQRIGTTVRPGIAADQNHRFKYFYPGSYAAVGNGSADCIRNL